MKFAALLLLALCAPFGAEAQQGKVDVAMQFAGVVSCDVHPLIPFRIDNVPFNVTGQATLGQDRKASMALTIAGLFAPTHIRLKATLGGAPARVPGGTAELRVVSESEVRMTWTLQTSSLIVNMRMSGNSCSMDVDTQLKPGASRYSIYDGRTTHMCGKPQYTNLSCNAR